MTDEEMIAQMRDITGVRIRTCDLCGLPLPVHDRVDAAETADPEETQRLCPDCLALQARNEDPLPEPDDDELYAL
jgi:hypothetical protein